jgi:hypothetical protein
MVNVRQGTGVRALARRARADGHADSADLFLLMGDLRASPLIAFMGGVLVALDNGLIARATASIDSIRRRPRWRPSHVS